MARILSIVLLGLTGFVCFWLYQVKEDTHLAKQKIAVLKKQIAQEQRAINLLKAEWSYLNQPARLQELLKRHGARLKLGDMKIEQMVTLDQLANRLPKRLPPAPPLDRNGLEGLAAGLKNSAE